MATLCSNAVGVEPAAQVKRWAKRKGPAMISQSHVVARYNTGMSDIMDRSLADYRPAIRGKKWCWSVLLNAVSIAVVYRWKGYQLCTNDQVKQEFHRSLVTVMVKQSQPRLRAE